jgi:excisionase family DNA binding protein
MDKRAAQWTADSGDEAGAAGWLSASAAAATLGVSQRTIRRAIARGDLPAAKRAGVYRIAPADLERYRTRGRVADLPRLIPFPDREAPVAPHPPRPLTPLIGREREVAAVGDLVRRDGVRLVTLVGPGGVGKTRLALRVAEQVAAGFPEGVWFVALAPVRDPTLVAPTIVRTLGVVERADRPAVETLTAVLRDRRLLLVLDNFEHLLAAAPLVAELLAACPKLVVLVTSRSRLNLSGEHGYSVPPLALPHRPPQGAGPSFSVETIGDAAAVRLFVARAQAVDAAFGLTAENAAAVAALCSIVDGLPLAIELAAARTRLFAPAALLARMGRRLPLLTGGPRDQPTRLRTLADAIAWSHDLLSEAEQVLFRRLSIFVGGCTLEAAEAVAGGQGGRGADERSPAPLPPCPPVPLSPSVLDGIAALVDHQLLGRVDRVDRPDGGPDAGTPRFAMLETIREFGLERLADSGEEVTVRTAHARHFLAEAEEASAVFWGRRPGAWREKLEPDVPNLRAALAWLIETGDGEAALRLAAALEPAWWILCHQSEGRRWLARALALRDGVPDSVVVSALVVAGRVGYAQGDYAEAETLGREALALAEGVGVDPADALFLLGMVAADAEDPALRSEAAARSEAALASYRGRDEPARTAYALCRLAVLNLDAPVADLDRAREQLDEAITIFRGIGHAAGIALAAERLGEAAARGGDLPTAASRYREALALNVATGHPWGIARVFEGLARLAVETGHAETASRLSGAAAAIRDELGLPVPAPQRAAYDAAVARVRAALGPEGFVAAWDGGRSCPMAEVVAEADSLAARVGRSVPPATARAADDASGLSRREREVLALLVEGASDREIAAALSISYRTATNHVASILAKLDVPTRAAAAALAVRRGLA